MKIIKLCFYIFARLPPLNCRSLEMMNCAAPKTFFSLFSPELSLTSLFLARLRFCALSPPSIFLLANRRRADLRIVSVVVVS